MSDPIEGSGTVSTEKGNEENTGNLENKESQVTADQFFEKAKEKGWKPLEEYDGDPEEWVDAKEFVKRAPLFDRLKSQGKKLKDQEKALHDMGAHIEKVSQAAYNRAIADLKKEKAEAVSVADIAEVERIDREIEATRQEMVPVKQNDGIHPSIIEWVGKPENKWFNENAEMRAFAISYQQSLLTGTPDIDMDEALDKVARATKKAFPDKFTNPARATAAAVETATSAPTTGKKVYSFKDLNDEQRSIANRFERMGVMSKDQYVKELAESGLIGA